MPRKCGACGEYGHNKRTCSAKGSISPQPGTLSDAHSAPHINNIVWKAGQKINVKYPWDSFWVSTEIAEVHPTTGNVTLICLKRGCFYGLNLNTLEKHGIVVRRA